MLKRVPVRKKRRGQRRGPTRDAKYRRWLADSACAFFDIGQKEGRAVADYARLRLLACPGSAFARIDPAHTENNGMSSKGPDSSCVPLCRSHHLEYDSGREAFESKYGIDMKAIAAAYWERYQQERAA
jgi:hypothetical protein